MEYTPPHDDLMVAITYGSHLYGTSTPTSDHDFKAVYLPSLKSLMLAKVPNVKRYRFDADGNTVSDSSPMPDNGYEAEHTPIQKFVHDYLGGQAYAVETVFGVVQGAHLKHMPPPCTEGARRFCQFEAFCRLLAKKYVHKNVNGMVGFALKQTLDYVRRGERLNAAKEVLEFLEAKLKFMLAAGGGVRADLCRLDSEQVHMNEAGVIVHETILEKLVAATGLETGITVNQERTIRTLKLNGREYLETTTLPNMINAVAKMVDQYGERSTRASETDVDWKSLSHAVRVYQQVIELLKTGFITFPRSNAEGLLAIKRGHMPLASVKDLLRELDDEVASLITTSELPEASTLRDAIEAELLAFLERLYA